jgi:hypothetical protein
MMLCLLAAGCSQGLVRDGGADIPSEAVRQYARAHGLSREEARRELELLRDANTLKELRQMQPPQTEGASAQFAPVESP